MESAFAKAEKGKRLSDMRAGRRPRCLFTHFTGFCTCSEHRLFAQPCVHSGGRALAALVSGAVRCGQERSCHVQTHSKSCAAEAAARQPEPHITTAAELIHRSCHQVHVIWSSSLRPLVTRPSMCYCFMWLVMFTLHPTRTTALRPKRWRCPCNLPLLLPALL